METIQDLILRYGVLLGKRNSEKQKKKFLRAAQKQFEQEGFRVDITRLSTNVFQKETMNAYNLYAGNLKTAKTMLITYYDTPLYHILPKSQKAFDSNWSKSNYILHSMISLMMIIVMTIFLCIVVIPHLQNIGFLSIWGVLLVICSIAGFKLIHHLRGGMAKRNNLNRNSSSLITMIGLASGLSDDEKKNIAFAFIDEGTRSELGLRMLDDYLKDVNMKRIYLDVIGNKGNLHSFSTTKISDIQNLQNHPMFPEGKRFGDILIASGVIRNKEILIQSNIRSDNLILEKQINEAIIVIKEIVKTLQTV